VSDAIRSHHEFRLNRRTFPAADLLPTRGRLENHKAPRACAGVVALLAQETKTLPPFEEHELEDKQLLSSAAAEIYRMRRARDRIMPNGLMGEPAWDILLALYAEDAEKLTISSLCFGAGVPQTTALRWIGTLNKVGLVVRNPHPRDGRLILVSLSEQGRLIVERCLKAMLRASRR
jgi:DNA-binding MarR family transcriptional regulator